MKRDVRIREEMERVAMENEEKAQCLAGDRFWGVIHWSFRQDRQTGRWYYFNWKTRETSWEKPSILL